MGAVYFYHLTRAPLRETVRLLLHKAQGVGWHVLIRSPDKALLEQLDEWLWISPEDSFLPHAMAGGRFDHLQPVLLSCETTDKNKAACLFSLGADNIDPHEAAQYERICFLFDGHEETALGHARGQWKTLVAAGVGAQYWSEQSGAWRMQAESGQQDKP